MEENLADQKRDAAKDIDMMHLMRAVLDSTNANVFAKDISGRFILSNLVHTRHLGKKSPEEVIGQRAEDFTHSPEKLAQYKKNDEYVLKSGKEITYENIALTLEDGGIRAVSDDGTDPGSHQAFWFAWSQFYPETALWPLDE